MPREEVIRDGDQAAYHASNSDAATSTLAVHKTLHAAACFTAISLAFLVYGVLQERMMTVGFGAHSELFTWSLFLVFCNRLLTCTFALCALGLQSGTIWPVAPLQAYAAVSFGNLVASVCQYDSLKYVSFALQTLAKCCKMLPVMLWGFFIGGQRFSASEIVTAAAVTGGCGVFIFSGDVLSDAVRDSNTFRYFAIGIFLLLVYLAVDGFVSTWQARLFDGYKMDTSNQVLYTTLFSCLLSAVVLVMSEDMKEALAFLRRHPDAWAYIAAVSTVAAVIQFFVSYTIREYGALTFATLMTARQFLSIIASCVVFSHFFSVGQWIGAFVVFGALGARIAEKQLHGKHDKVPDSPLPPRATSEGPLIGAGMRSGDLRHTSADRGILDLVQKLEPGPWSLPSGRASVS